jgi:hypothetical protein
MVFGSSWTQVFDGVVGSFWSQWCVSHWMPVVKKNDESVPDYWQFGSWQDQSRLSRTYLARIGAAFTWKIQPIGLVDFDTALVEGCQEHDPVPCQIAGCIDTEESRATRSDTEMQCS